MSIDEAIAHAREMAEKKFIEAKEIFKWEKEHEELYENAREYNQIAEWLEELKAIKSTRDIPMSEYARGFRQGYEKGQIIIAEHDAKIKADAIDEAIKKLAESEDTILSDRQYYTLMELKDSK